MGLNQEKIVFYKNKRQALRSEQANKMQDTNIAYWKKVKGWMAAERRESRLFTFAILFTALFNVAYMVYRLLFTGVIYSVSFAFWSIFAVLLLPELIIFLWATAYFIKGYHYEDSFFSLDFVTMLLIGVPALVVYVFVLSVVGSLWETLALLLVQVLALAIIWVAFNFKYSRSKTDGQEKESFAFFPYGLPNRNLASFFHVVLLILVVVGTAILGFSGAIKGFSFSERGVNYIYDKTTNEYRVRNVYPSVWKDTLGFSKDGTLVLDEEVQILYFKNGVSFKEGKVVGIEDNAFDGVSSIEKVVLPESVREVEMGAFEESGVKRLNVSSKVFSIVNGQKAKADFEVFVCNAACKLIVDNGATLRLVASQETVQTLRAANPQVAALFSPEIAEDQFFVNYNYGDYKTEIYPKGSAQEITLRANAPVGSQVFFYHEVDGENQLLNETFSIQENINVFCATAKTYQITYNAMGGQVEENTQSYVDLQSLRNTLNQPVKIAGVKNAPLVTAEKRGYTFNGWTIDDSNPLLELPTDASGDKTAKAKWALIEYDIEYAYVSSEGTLLTQSFYNTNRQAYTVETENLSLSSAFKAGYTFDDWYEDIELTKKVEEVAIPEGSVGNRRFYTKVCLNAPTVTENGYEGIYDGEKHSLSLQITHQAPKITGASKCYFNGQVVHSQPFSLNTTTVMHDIFQVKDVADSGTYTYQITLTDGELSTTYESPIGISAQIDPKTLSVSWGDTSFVYDGTELVPETVIGGVIDGDSLGNHTQGGATNAQAAAYTAQVEWNNANYLLTNTSTVFYIAKANYDMSGVTMTDKQVVYDGTTHSIFVKGELPTGADGEQLRVIYEGECINVGEPVTVTATFATDSTNYNVPSSMSAKLTVTPASVTVTWTNTSLVYNGLEQQPTAQYTGIIGEDSLDSQVVGVGINAKEEGYTAQVEWNNANYLLTNASTVFYIAKANYDMSGVTMTDKQVVYDGTTHSIFVKGELPTGADGEQLRVTYEGECINVGEPVTVTATFATDSTNYNVPSSMSAKLTVTPATIAVNFVGYSGEYDGAEHEAAIVATATGVREEALEILYSLDGISYFLKMPLISAIGTHIVYYRIGQGNGNYQLSEGSFEAMITETENAV